MSLALPPPLLGLTPGDLGHRDPECGDPGSGDAGPGESARLWDAATRAVAAGLRGILWREPHLSDAESVRWLERLAGLLGEVDGWLGVHDRLHLARALGASGAHLGYRSLAPEDARRAVGGELALGLSTHAGDDPRPPREVDYVVFGPVRDTPSKRGLLEPVGFEALARRCARSDRPVWAIGGLAPGHVAAAREAGAAGVAVRGALLAAEDPAAAARRFLEELEGWDG